MMLLLVTIVSLLFIQGATGDAVIKASFRACPGSCGTIWYRPDDCDGNPSNSPPSTTSQIMDIIAWTWNSDPKTPCHFGLSRALLRFDQITDAIPSTAIITSATLKLVGAGPDQSPGYAFSYFPGSYLEPAYAPAHYGPNRVNITRVTSPYSISTVTWNTQPTSQGPPSIIPESNVQYYYNVAIDVRHLVQEMIAPGANNGFLFQFQIEDYYRSMNFFSCNADDCSTRPLLEVDYILICNNTQSKIASPTDQDTIERKIRSLIR